MDKIGNEILEVNSSLIDKNVYLKDVIGSLIKIKVLDVYDLNIGFPTKEIKGEVLKDSPESGYVTGEIDEWMLQVCKIYEVLD